MPENELTYHGVMFNADIPDGLHGDVEAWLREEYESGHAWEYYTAKCQAWQRFAPEIIKMLLNE